MIISSQKGRIVVEAAIIFPIVFLSVLAVLYICTILFERAYLQSLADMSVERGALMWRNSSIDTSIGSVSKDKIKQGQLYWRLIDLKEEEKKNLIKNYVNSRLEFHNILMSAQKPEISVDVKAFIAYKSLVINIDRKFKIPIGNVLKLVGMSPYYTISARAEAVINQPDEFIRNTDLVLDVEKEIEARYPGYGRNVQKVREGMNDLERNVAVILSKDGNK